MTIVFHTDSPVLTGFGSTESIPNKQKTGCKWLGTIPFIRKNTSVKKQVAHTLEDTILQLMKSIRAPPCSEMTKTFAPSSLWKNIKFLLQKLFELQCVKS